MWRHRLWFFSVKQVRRHTSPVLSSPSVGSDDYGCHGHMNHQYHDRIQIGRSEVLEKDNLAMRVLEGISATTFISTLVKATRCRFQGLIDGNFTHYTVAGVLPKTREQVTSLKLSVFI